MNNQYFNSENLENVLEKYGRDITKNVKDGKVDKKALEPYRLRWQKEVLELQDSATSYEKRPVRKLKLKPKHQNNNE